MIPAGIAGLASLRFGPKKVAKVVETAKGMPEWVGALVDKVIKEGMDVTKRFATKDRETVHMKKLDNDNTVLVYEDIDAGTIRVEYDSPDNMFGESVQLQYKKPLPDEGDPNPAAEFEVAESGIVGRAQGPDDYDLEIEEVSGDSISDLESDLTILKEYATGQKSTAKEISKSKERKQNVRRYESPEGQGDYVIKRQGEADDYYTDDYDYEGE